MDSDLSRVVLKHFCMYAPAVHCLLLLCGLASGGGTRGLWRDELFGTAMGSETGGTS